MAVSSTETEWKNEGKEAEASGFKQIQIRAITKKRKNQMNEEEVRCHTCTLGGRHRLQGWAATSIIVPGRENCRCRRWSCGLTVEQSIWTVHHWVRRDRVGGLCEIWEKTSSALKPFEILAQIDPTILIRQALPLAVPPASARLPTGFPSLLILGFHFIPSQDRRPLPQMILVLPILRFHATSLSIIAGMTR